MNVLPLPGITAQNISCHLKMTPLISTLLGNHLIVAKREKDNDAKGGEKWRVDKFPRSKIMPGTFLVRFWKPLQSVNWVWGTLWSTLERCTGEWVWNRVVGKKKLGYLLVGYWSIPAKNVGL